MNIAVYSHYFTPEIGAPSARIYDLAQAWLALGQQVQVFTCFPNHPIGQLYAGYRSRLYMHENLSGIDVHRHWTYITPNKGFVKKTLGHISYLLSTCLLNKQRLDKPDVMIGTSPTLFAAIAAATAAALSRRPFIMEVRDLWPAVFVELGVLRNRRLIAVLEGLELFLYRQATCIVTVTESFRSHLIQRGVPAEKIHTIPNGADIAFWQPMLPQPELRQRLRLEGCFVVLYIGAHGISQNLSRILESAGQLQEYSNIRFVFVGEGAEKDQLVYQAQQSGLNNVMFLDPVTKEEVRQFYALADVCLVPLRNIPLFKAFIPSKMFEIMAMARPIIGSVQGEAADILQRSGGAVVVEPENSTAIAQTVLMLYQNQDDARRIGQQGHQFVVDHYSRHALAIRYLAVLNQAIAAYQSRRT